MTRFPGTSARPSIVGVGVRHLYRSLALLPALALVAAACGDDTTAVGAGSPNRPTGPDDVVVQVSEEGGFVPVEVALSTVPSVTVLGDGTVITAAPYVQIYPGPAILPLQSAKIGADRVDALVAKAAELGLLDAGLTFGQPPVADAHDTKVTIVAGGVTYRHTANALGLDGGGSGVTREQAANRTALSAFVDATRDLPAGDSAWTPSEVAVINIGPYQADPELNQAPIQWPLATPPATATPQDRFACTVVSGSDARTLLDTLAKANSRTPWVVDGQQRSLAFRPVVPGATACPGGG